MYAMQAPYIKMARLAKAIVLKALVLKAINVWKKSLHLCDASTLYQDGSTR
jgi:hypothetical protein